jgi:SAM-dependent methyltransferase
LLYNPGHATEAAVEQIGKLLAAKVRSRRPREYNERLLLQFCGGTIRDKVRRRLASRIASPVKKAVTSALDSRGYVLSKAGMGFVDARNTVGAARQAGLSVCDYRESLEADPRKKGRRDRIIENMRQAGVMEALSSVCEVGAGTGQYLEKVVEIARPKTYEVYETDPGWRNFLQSEYGVTCHAADGRTLRQTASGSCDLVHAHGVFVYLPLLQNMEYLNEFVRVCRPGGFIVFDCCLEKHFSSLATVNEWLSSPHRFPVVIPEGLLSEFACANRLHPVRSFPMIYGSGEVQYFIWQKCAS